MYFSLLIAQTRLLLINKGSLSTALRKKDRVFFNAKGRRVFLNLIRYELVQCGTKLVTFPLDIGHLEFETLP
jgi:hypothetical protein